MALENQQNNPQINVRQYKENPLYKAGVSAAYKLGGALKGATKASAKAIDVGQFSGVANAVKGVGSNLMDKFKNIGTVTTPYGSSTRYEQFHPAVDYVVPGDIGAPVRSLTGGTVTNIIGGQKQGSPGFGNRVEITDMYGNRWYFSHLANGYVKVGQQINKGSVIGFQGNTGQSYSTHGGTGAHVDLRIKDAYNRYADPNSLI